MTERLAEGILRKLIRAEDAEIGLERLVTRSVMWIEATIPVELSDEEAAYLAGLCAEEGVTPA